MANKLKINEHAEQVLLFEWALNSRGAYPELEYFHAIPNGAKLPFSRDKHNIRYSNQAFHLKAEGLKRGVPDTCLPVPRSIFHGLYIELKSVNGRPTPEQVDFFAFLNTHGYLSAVCYGFDDARVVLEWYLNLPPFDQNAKPPDLPPEAVLYLEKEGKPYDEDELIF